MGVFTHLVGVDNDKSQDQSMKPFACLAESLLVTDQSGQTQEFRSVDTHLGMRLERQTVKCLAAALRRIVLYGELTKGGKNRSLHSRLGDDEPQDNG